MDKIEIDAKDLRKAIDMGLALNGMSNVDLANKLGMAYQGIMLIKKDQSTTLPKLVELISIMGGQVIIRYPKN